VRGGRAKGGRPAREGCLAGSRSGGGHALAFGIRGFFAGVEEASVSAGLELLCGSAFSSPIASPFFAFKGRAFFVAFALAGDDVEGESPATNGSGFTSGSAPRLPSTSCLFAFEALGVFLAALASAEGGERLEEGERSRLTEVEPFDRRGAMLRTVRRKIGRQDNVNDESAGRMMTDAILKLPMAWSCARHRQKRQNPFSRGVNPPKEPTANTIRCFLLYFPDSALKPHLSFTFASTILQSPLEQHISWYHGHFKLRRSQRTGKSNFASKPFTSELRNHQLPTFSTDTFPSPEPSTSNPAMVSHTRYFII